MSLDLYNGETYKVKPLRNACFYHGQVSFYILKNRSIVLVQRKCLKKSRPSKIFFPFHLKYHLKLYNIQKTVVETRKKSNFHAMNSLGKKKSCIMTMYTKMYVHMLFFQSL